MAIIKKTCKQGDKVIFVDSKGKEKVGLLMLKFKSGRVQVHSRKKVHTIPRKNLKCQKIVGRFI